MHKGNHKVKFNDSRYMLQNRFVTLVSFVFSFETFVVINKKIFLS